MTRSGNEVPVYLRLSEEKDAPELKDAFERSSSLHIPWIFPPEDMEEYIRKPHMYLVCLKTTHEIAGAYNISEIVRGWFQSAFLGFQAFVPHQGKGYMFQGMMLVLKEAFDSLKLHRLEANIQPGNHASIALVSKAGFEKEGFSPKYLRVGGNEWKDHERWAIRNDRWSGEKVTQSNGRGEYTEVGNRLDILKH
jgi:[ribosomal protein S5]-alanine N-acetyltransferase